MKTQWHYNPFQRLQEHATHPNSRFFRTSLWDKCIDTFVIIFGEQNESFDIISLGLIDYLCFGALIFLHHTFLKAYENSKKSFLSFLIFAIFALLNLTGWITKTVMSFFLTLVCLPITLLCHGLSLLLGGDRLHRDVLDLMGEDKSSINRFNASLNLNDFLTKHGRTLDELRVTLEITVPPITSQLFENSKQVGDRFMNLFNWHKESKNKPQQEKVLFAKSKLLFFYTHTAEVPWLSNSSFAYLSVLLASFFPCLALFSVQTLTQSAAERFSSAINGETNDVFEVIIDRANEKQQRQLSALFQLNISSVLNELHGVGGLRGQESALIKEERQRLTLLSLAG